MSKMVPFINADKSERWDDDLAIAEISIKKWLAEYRSPGETRTQLEIRLTKALTDAVWEQDLSLTIASSPAVLTALRSLTRRDMGTAQFADFVGIGSGVLTRFEGGERPRRLPADFTARCRDLVIAELDSELAAWVVQGRAPLPSEVSRSATIAADRILRRRSSTSLRYAHEPRQLGILSEFLNSIGYREQSGGPLSNPRADMAAGTYSFRRSVAGSMSGGGDLMQSVDVVLKPLGASSQQLPVFIEAKSMTDKVNPNKRQKEEAQKAASLRRKWGAGGEDVHFLLLLGGTVPRRYLEVERESGIDWIWEHRVEDLGPFLAQIVRATPS